MLYNRTVKIKTWNKKISCMIFLNNNNNTTKYNITYFVRLSWRFLSFSVFDSSFVKNCTWTAPNSSTLWSSYLLSWYLQIPQNLFCDKFFYTNEYAHPNTSNEYVRSYIPQSCVIMLKPISIPQFYRSSISVYHHIHAE